MYEAMPDKESYSQSFQQGIMDLWTTEGSMPEKLSALIAAVEVSNPNYDDIHEAFNDLLSLVSLGLGDTLDSVSGQGDVSLWADLLSSGMALAHEHFPEEYISWLYAVDDPMTLFGHSSDYHSLVFSGTADVVITRLDESGDTVVYDPACGITSAAVVRL